MYINYNQYTLAINYKLFNKITTLSNIISVIIYLQININKYYYLHNYFNLKKTETIQYIHNIIIYIKSLKIFLFINNLILK